MVKTEWNDALRTVAEAAQRLLGKHDRILVSIDGRAASGKSTFAADLSRRLDCSVVHMDDFYLHNEQRTPERMREPGGNVDYERVLKEVIEPWMRDGRFSYRPYDPHTDTWGDELVFDPAPVTIIEGAYSGHPAIRDAEHLHVFVTTDLATQLDRIRNRNGSRFVEVFKNKWIPLEEEYFSAYRVPENSDCTLET